MLSQGDVMLNERTDFRRPSRTLAKRKKSVSSRIRIGLLFFPALIFFLQEFALPTGSRHTADFETQVSHLINQPKFDAGFWGIYIVSLKEGHVLYSLNEGKRFLPASSMKLLIGAAVLDRLGPDYHFETPVYAQGRVDTAGRLLGDLLLVGKGDPNLEGRIYKPGEENPPKSTASLFVERVADQVVSTGITRIEGDIIGEDMAFLYEPYGIGWEHDDLQWGYGAPASALSVNENAFSVEILPGEVIGDPVWISTFPLPQAGELVNKLKTVPRGQPVSIGIERSLDKGQWTFQGELPLGGDKLVYNLAVADPAEYAAILFKAALEKRGIQVAGRAAARHLSPLDVLQDGKPSLERAKAQQPRYTPEQQVAKSKSAPLIETVKIMMKVSHNLYAELLFRKLGAEASGVGAIESGAAAVKSFLEKAGASKAGEHNQELNFSDGSGISRTDQLTPASIVRLLQYMDRHPHSKLFLETLPVAGVDGTLKYRMQRTSAEARIHAKTGTIGFVSTLSGYAFSKNGDRFAFAIMANNHAAPAQEVRAVIDQICVIMTEYDSRKRAYR